MTQQEFLEKFVCRFNVTDIGRQRIMHTELLKREDQTLIGAVKSEFDILETDAQIHDAKVMGAIIPIDWDIIKESTMRYHLDYFIVMFKVQDFYPANRATDISGYFLN